jgi:hypothetical protein
MNSEQGIMNEEVKAVLKNIPVSEDTGVKRPVINIPVSETLTGAAASAKNIQ